MTTSKERFWEIDLLRGVAVIMMVTYHALYDLDYFGICHVQVHSGFWSVFARVTAIIFLILVGVSLHLSHTRKMRTGASPKFSKYLWRGLFIFSCGLVVTLITWIFMGRGFVVFGVLHLIGIAIILAYPFLRFRFLNLFFGGIAIFLGILLRDQTFDFPWLLWLGFIPRGFYSVDYFPVFPWFGAILVGIFFGRIFYPNFSRVFSVQNLPDGSFGKLLCFLGKNSLRIYLIHQPILIAVIYLLRFSEIPMGQILQI